MPRGERGIQICSRGLKTGNQPQVIQCDNKDKVGTDERHILPAMFTEDAPEEIHYPTDKQLQQGLSFPFRKPLQVARRQNKKHSEQHNGEVGIRNQIWLMPPLWLRNEGIR